MNQEDLFKKLGLILNELNDQYQFLAQNPQQLSELELELFQANAKFLADHVQIIKKMNATQQPPLSLPVGEEELSIQSHPIANDEYQEENQIEAVTFVDEVCEDELEETNSLPQNTLEVNEAPPITDIEQEVFKIDNSPSTFEFILNDHAEHEKFDKQNNTDEEPERNGFFYNESKFDADEKFEFEEKSVDELFNRPLSEEEEHILAQKLKLRTNLAEPVAEPDEDEIGPEPFLVQSKEEFPIQEEDLELEVAPIAETKVNSQEPVEDPNYTPTLNDILARKTQSINTTSNTEIKDLKQAINLNDKLLYIKDLFNGYNLAYSEAIDIANKLPNFEAADNFFQKNYAIKNNWAEKQATVDQFYRLLNARFSR